jgi:RING-type zinc-finger
MSNKQKKFYLSLMLVLIAVPALAMNNSDENPRFFTTGPAGEEHLCGICEERQANISLPCGHLYCERCIQSIMRKCGQAQDKLDIDRLDNPNAKADGSTEAKCPGCRTGIASYDNYPPTVSAVPISQPIFLPQSELILPRPGQPDPSALETDPSTRSSNDIIVPIDNPPPPPNKLKKTSNHLTKVKYGIGCLLSAIVIYNIVKNIFKDTAEDEEE